MLLTLYYMYATFLQWWKIGVTKAKISQTISKQSALVLYKKNQIINKYENNIEDLIFYNEEKIGCTIVPKKKISLANWLPFSSSNFFPYSKNIYSKIGEPSFTVLIQADVKNFNNGPDFDQLQISDLGVPIAWTAAENFGIILKTDLDNLSKLVSCFLANSIAINDGMEILHIEIIDIEGDPKMTENEKLPKKIKWPKIISNQKQWKHLIEDLKNVCKKVNQICSSQNGNVHKNTTQEKILLNSNTLEVESKIHLCVSEENNSKQKIKTDKRSKIEEKSHKKSSASIDRADKIDKMEKSVNKLDKIEKKLEREKQRVDKRGEKSTKNVEKIDKSKVKRTKELTQERMKQSSSMDRIKKETDKHKKESHKSKREKFAKRHSDDRLLNKDVEIDKDISKHSEIKKEAKHIEEKEIDETLSMKKRFKKAKPPNVLVCADSLETKENVKTVLKNIINKNKYIIYELPSSGDPHFAENSTLVIVCGNINPNLNSQLLQYFLNGGNLLCLCSDFLNSVLHTFTTAEVREHELVRFSYGSWKNVRMMHHIFCYQASPAKKHFSQDSDPNSSNQSSGNSPVAPRTPSTVELHHSNKSYIVQVQVLGTEETWHTPSILLAKVKNGTGKAVFSQVHLEIDPTQYIDDEAKCIALKESDKTRLEILKDILSNHLNMDCTNAEDISLEFKPAYFLGRNDLKQELLSSISGITENMLRLPKLTLNFCGKDIEPPKATEKLLPVLIHSCPNNFSTVQYFENLQTDILGRVVLYSDILTSSMDIISGTKFKNGFVVIPRLQTSGIGRSGNIWLSPEGCAMFSIQLHIPMESVLGKSLPLIQHLIVIAVVSAIRIREGYENIDIGIKWPNDVYAYSNIKIGGVIVSSVVDASIAICNIGFGINLSNAEPTICLNAIISKYNKENAKNLEAFSFEKFLALTFTELERILNIVQNENLDYLFDLYYKYWLHSDTVVSVQTSENIIKDVVIIGIDKFGYLVVRSKDGTTSSVQPDNNTFDMMQGLIAPKIR